MARRFQFSVPGRRGESDPWFTVGTVEVTTTVLVTALAALGFVIYAIGGVAGISHLAEIPRDVRGGEVWRLATWPMVNIPGQGTFGALWSLLNIFFFWWLGRQVEGEMGRRRFLIFIVAITIIAAVVGVAINSAVLGIELLALAPFVAFVTNHAFAKFLLNIPAWGLGPERSQPDG
jgi:membrane associated rhomboid family serine protease